MKKRRRGARAKTNERKRSKGNTLYILTPDHPPQRKILVGIITECTPDRLALMGASRIQTQNLVQSKVTIKSRQVAT